MDEYLIQKETLTSIADAIREKTGTTGTIKLTDMASKIGEISVSGGENDGSVKSKAVNFYDPMGNIIYSYTRAEAATLTELPPGPELDGFEFDMWSHTLEQVISTQFFADVTPLYKKNGKSTTVLILDVSPYTTIINIWLRMLGSTSFTIDWGDGTVETKSESSGYNKQYQHTYATIGRKCIAIYRTSGSYKIGLGSQYSSSSSSSRHSVVSTVPQVSNVDGYTATRQLEHSLLSVICSDHSYIDTLVDNTCVRLVSLHPNGAENNNGRYAFLPSLKAITTITTHSTVCLSTITPCGLTSLKRLAIYLGSDSYRCACSDMLDLQDLYIGPSVSYVLYTMNVNRRVIINRTSVPNKYSSSYEVRWGSGDIYVPDSAIETYKASALFAPVIDCIKPISEYPDC